MSRSDLGGDERYDRGSREFNTVVRTIRGMAEELGPGCQLHGWEEYSTNLRQAAPYNDLFKRCLASVVAEYPDVREAQSRAWDKAKGKLVEVLSVLGILVGAERPPTGDIWNLFGTSRPIGFQEKGQRHFLWTQPFVKDSASGLAARPDIAITTDSKAVSRSNILRVVECKCTRALGAQTLRCEFGKAKDLRIQSYFIWSYHTPRPKLLAGAKILGIDLVGLGLLESIDTYEVDPAALGRFVVATLADVASNKRFLTSAREDVIAIERKDRLLDT